MSTVEKEKSKFADGATRHDTFVKLDYHGNDLILYLHQIGAVTTINREVAEYQPAVNGEFAAFEEVTVQRRQLIIGAAGTNYVVDYETDETLEADTSYLHRRVQAWLAR